MLKRTTIAFSVLSLLWTVSMLAPEAFAHDCVAPEASFSVNPDTVCVGCPVDVNASASYDPDGTTLTYDWAFGDGETGTGKSAAHSYDEAGEYTITLTVTDNDDPCCCTDCNDKTDDCNDTVTVVDVNSVVEYGTTDEGPLYVCPDDTVNLEAKPNPAGASFPTGEPHWSIVSQPPNANAALDPSSGSATTTLSGLTKLGEYIIKAKCGDSDGDTITVTNELENESIWYHYNPSSGEIPIPCLPVACDGEDSTEYDDCENELEVSCCQADGTGGAFGCAYHYFYNDGLISSCIFLTMADNTWLYKEATIEGSENRVFTKMKHVNADLDGNEGCAGYYCTKIEIYDCLTGEYDPNSPYWRRDTDSAPLDIDQGEECPGH